MTPHLSLISLFPLLFLLFACGARTGLRVERSDAGSPSSLSSARTLSVSWDHACAIVDGGVLCWGENGLGVLGDGTTTTRTTPTAVPGLDGVVEIASGQTVTCARRSDDTVWCWGAAAGSMTPRVVPGFPPLSSLVAGSSTVCGIARDAPHALYCSGDSYVAGTSCTSDATLGAIGPARFIAGTNDTVGVALGQKHACLFDSAGVTRCFGCTRYSALGSASPDTATPILVPGVARTVRIAAETEATCAADAAGTTRCWGEGSQFGPSITIAPTAPIPVALPHPRDLDVGVTFSCAVTGASDITCLGGLPTFADACRDRVAGPMHFSAANLAELSVGYEMACARDRSGSIWCWGCNGIGEVGDGTMTARAAPVRIL